MCAFSLDDFKGAAPRTHPDGDGKPRHHRSHPFSTGHDLCLVNGSLSNHNRLRESLRREGIDFQTENDTEVAAGYLAWRLREGASARAGARGLPGRPRRLRSSSGRRTASPCCATPSPAARRARRDGRLGGDGLRVASIARLPGAAEARSWGARRRLRLGAGEGRDACRGGDRGGGRVVDLAATPLRELNSASMTCPRPREPRHWRVLNPNGAHAVACGLDADVEVEIDGHVGYYLRRDEQARNRARPREREHRPRREHDVRHGRDRGQRQPVGGCHGARRAMRRARRRAAARMRDLDEGHRHRRARIRRTPERVHGADRPPRRLQRRRRGAPATPIYEARL